MIANGADWKVTPLAMFTAYFDASGDSHSQIALAVAGFVSHAEAWIEWEKEWLSRLRQDGLEYFHRKDLYGWERWKRERLIDDLSAIIKTHVSSKAGVVVINSDLQAQLSVKARKKWRVDAYSLAARTIAKEMRIWASGWGGKCPELVFEEGDNGKGDLTYLLENDGYPSPIFKPKKSYVHRKSGLFMQAAAPLQAADLLAYELFYKARAIRQSKEASRSFSRIHPVIDKIPGQCEIITPDHLRFLEHGLEQMNSLILVPNIEIKNIRTAGV